MTPKFTSTLPIEPKSRSLRPARLLAAAAGALLLVSAIAPLAIAQTPTLLVLRAVPAAKGKKVSGGAALPPLTQADIAGIKLGGKDALVTAFEPLLKGSHTLQLMVVLDSEQMLGAKGQFEDLENFLHSLPANVVIGVGWMLQGNVKIVQPFTSDRELVYKAFVPQTREQAANGKNDNGNPFSCLKQLAYNWPDADPAKLRAVLFFNDGIIRGNGQSYDASRDNQNPNVEGTSQAMQRNGVIPFPFFWLDPVVPDPNRSEGGNLEGQQNFSQLVTDTGGAALYEGMFAPGTLTPLLNKLYATLASSAVVTVAAPYPAGKTERLDIKSSRDDIAIFGPDQVFIGNAASGKK
jgi:hypothetical protein